MKILLMSMRMTLAQSYNEKRNSIAYDYVKYFEKLGYLIVLIPNNTKNLKKYFNMKIDLVVLSGGNNVNPKLYNNKNKLDDVSNKRDNTEKILLKLAIKNKIKILGICRGFHMINVYFGGSLVHNIKNHVNKNHKIYSNKKILNNKKTNSFHNQAILKNNLSSNLEILATTKDDIIEACLSKNKKILCMQWHPERDSNKLNKKLMHSFIKENL